VAVGVVMDSQMLKMVVVVVLVVIVQVLLVKTLAVV
jgi:hypothetical protein